MIEKLSLSDVRDQYELVDIMDDIRDAVIEETITSESFRNLLENVIERWEDDPDSLTESQENALYKAYANIKYAQDTAEFHEVNL